MMVPEFEARIKRLSEVTGCDYKLLVHTPSAVFVALENAIAERDRARNVKADLDKCAVAAYNAGARIHGASLEFMPLDERAPTEVWDHWRSIVQAVLLTAAGGIR